MWSAADSGDLATALIPAVWTFLGIVVVTLGTIAVQAMKGRSEQAAKPVTTSEPVPAGNGNGTAHLLTLAKEQGVLHQRADDSDERDDMQDRRLNNLERWAERHDPTWNVDDRA